ncbi:MAG: PHP domain-containing protein [Enterocloster clostridioformis]
MELHCHTKMSDMDGVSEVKGIIKRAKQWGMPAVAVTDHGCVQAFPDANHALDKGDTFKILYGVEGYLVDDTKTAGREFQGPGFSGYLCGIRYRDNRLQPKEEQNH